MIGRIIPPLFFVIRLYKTWLIEDSVRYAGSVRDKARPSPVFPALPIADQGLSSLL